MTASKRTTTPIPAPQSRPAKSPPAPAAHAQRHVRTPRRLDYITNARVYDHVVPLIEAAVERFGGSRTAMVSACVWSALAGKSDEEIAGVLGAYTTALATAVSGAVQSEQNEAPANGRIADHA